MKPARGKQTSNKLSDGEGLFLRLKPTGAKRWQFRYIIPRLDLQTGEKKLKENLLSFGPYATVPLDSSKIHGMGFDGPVPIELKLANKWSGPELFERMENQVCGDCLRDRRSSRGIFLLVNQGGARVLEDSQAWGGGDL